MLKHAGIVRKTFLFVALLIALVTLASISILYFAMPSYYLYKKEQLIKGGMTNLEQSLKKSSDLEVCASLIAEFSETYNVTVTAIDHKGMLIVELTSPFITMKTKKSGSSPLIINGEAADDDQLSTILNQLYQNLDTEQNMTDGEAGENDANAFILYDTGNIMFFESDINTEIINKIQIQGTLQPIEEARTVILSLIPYVLAAGCTIGLFLAWIYARRITKPILILSATAVKMKNMEPDVVAKIDTRDELGLLSENMDALYQSLSSNIANLKIEMEKVNRLEQSKTEMMQSASHELKTPIAALSGILDGMIDNIGVYKDKDTYLLKCKEQVEKLSFLVKEILEASRSDRRGQAERSAEIEVDEMLRQILHDFESLIREKQLILEIHLEKVILKTDPALFYRSVTNLVSNAVNYTPTNGVVCITLLKNQLSFQNQCDPIPDQEIEKLFEPFYTRSSSRDKLVSGTGLGLYIVKRNLERLSIPYQVESTEAGFTVILTLK